ncbi:hypothetical protein GCM10028824_12860 [Hymenobacter segetis]
MPASSTLPAVTKPIALKGKKLKSVTNTDFYITIQLGNDATKVVTLYASEWEKVKKNGIEFELKKGDTVDLGSLKELLIRLKVLTEEQGAEISAKSKGEEPIAKIIGLVLDADATVTQFLFREGAIDADGNRPNAEFKLKLNGKLMDPDSLKIPKPVVIGNLFSVVEAGFSVESKYVEDGDGEK